MCLWLCVRGSAHGSGMKPNGALLRVMRLLRVPLVRGQCPRESRQRSVERLPSSRAEDWRLRAKAGCSPGMKFRSQARQIGDHKSHGFRFCLPDLLGGQSATFTAVQHLVTDLVHERGELLSRLHPGKQRDLPAMGHTLCRSNSLGEAEVDPCDSTNLNSRSRYPVTSPCTSVRVGSSLPSVWLISKTYTARNPYSSADPLVASSLGSSVAHPSCSVSRPSEQE